MDVYGRRGRKKLIDKLVFLLFTLGTRFWTFEDWDLGEVLHLLLFHIYSEKNSLVGLELFITGVYRVHMCVYRGVDIHMYPPGVLGISGVYNYVPALLRSILPLRGLIVLRASYKYLCYLQVLYKKSPEFLSFP